MDEPQKRSNPKIKRRTLIKMSAWVSLTFWFAPIQKAFSFSATRSRHRRVLLSSGRLRGSQTLLLALAVDNSRKLRGSQVLQVVLAKNNQQSLWSSQIVQSVLAKETSQVLRSSQTLLIVLTPT